MSSVSAITNSVSTDPSTADSVPSGSQQTLTQKDFLQLLVSQMQNQDPLNPQSDTAMAAQMAQFTSLQQTSAMSSSLAMIQANSLLGSTVDLQVDLNTMTTGVVDGVVLQNGTPQIAVNGMTYNLGQVVSVSPTMTNQAASN
jgi:flagellar basal-body rod modification protein FlgD